MEWDFQVKLIKMKIERKSIISGNVTTMYLDVTNEQMERFNDRRKNGEYIQNIFPELTPDEREFILTGMTKQEWDETFSDK